MNLKALLKDTAIYGMSSIIGRFLNYLLVPLYTYKIAAESGGYGIVTNLYAYSALLLALLTFGMETTFFRFSGKQGKDPNQVYSSALIMVGSVSLLFLALVFSFLRPISEAMAYAAHPEYIASFALIGAMDAIQAIMFSRLRQQRRPIRFMVLKLSYIVLNIGLNLFIFLLMPKIPALLPIFQRFDGGVGLIFFANLLCTFLVGLLFLPELRFLRFGISRQLAREMLRYSFPLLLLSLVGILNQVADKILFPYLLPGPEGQVQLGIYGACVKIAMIMALLTQAFRYAYEPIVFSGKDKNDPDTLSQGMKFFILFANLAWLAVMMYMPILKHFIQPAYWEGLKVVPIVMSAEVFMGVYFNLSFWYKLSDQTWWGALMSGIGAAIMIAINVIFVPKYGYMACAWGGFAGYGSAMLLSYVIGQKKYPIHYETKRIMIFTLAAVAIYLLYHFILSRWALGLNLAVSSIILIIYLYFIYKELKK
ncbi:MAG: lipopolysaccharide biosynthesis protein [Candidatus Cryptobacteroides sp.]